MKISYIKRLVVTGFVAMAMTGSPSEAGWGINFESNAGVVAFGEHMMGKGLAIGYQQGIMPIQKGAYGFSVTTLRYYFQPDATGGYVGVRMGSHYFRIHKPGFTSDGARMLTSIQAGYAFPVHNTLRVVAGITLDTERTSQQPIKKFAIVIGAHYLIR